MRVMEDFPGCYLECEDPDTADSPEEYTLRKRRIGFYQRNGAYLSRVRARLFGVTYRMLWLPPASGFHVRQAGPPALIRIWMNPWKHRNSFYRILQTSTCPFFLIRYLNKI